MKRFEYRSARFATSMPVRYMDADVAIEGTCTQISTDGMEMATDGQRPHRRRGRVSLRYGDKAVEVDVRVAHMNRDRCGMQFLYESERQSKMIAGLIAALAGSADMSA
jgi:hypothetical protein